MEYMVKRGAPDCSIVMRGTFTFSDNNQFREILALAKDQAVKGITLEIDELQFIDSAALGMLLLLHDEASKRQIRITLSGASGQIKKMLQISNFEEIFTIIHAG